MGLPPSAFNFFKYALILRSLLNCVRQLDVGTFQHFLQTVHLPGTFIYKTFSVTNQFPQLILPPIRDIAWLEQSMLENANNSFRIFHICFPTQNRLIDHHSIQARRFKDVVQKLPIGGSALPWRPTCFEPASSRCYTCSVVFRYCHIGYNRSGERKLKKTYR